MSERTPWMFIVFAIEFTALTSDRESERIQSLVMPRCRACERASLIANPSVKRADWTCKWNWQPSEAFKVEVEASKIQARPADEVYFFQAASVLQITVPSGIDWGLVWF